ncbi:hypothetical protein BDV28DRAFT_141411 [Aspergillus coremiiformis]|uniref:Uncharacterized protein n=1 Tax=Aspergillus coremiiformis TaxID=138285 RepID=A0A5N6YWP0_9EURO|nr:hypothetical protein BDV28DRAFT_141411 [Aspergillus coremiiformis]
MKAQTSAYDCSVPLVEHDHVFNSPEQRVTLTPQSTKYSPQISRFCTRIEFNEAV